MPVASDQCLRVSCKVLARRKVVPNRPLLQFRVFRVRGIHGHLALTTPDRFPRNSREH